MKTSIFDMTFTLPPMVEMVKEEKEMPKMTIFSGLNGIPFVCETQETDMKTSLFNMTLTLLPMLEMVKEEKEMPSGSNPASPCGSYLCPDLRCCAGIVRRLI